MSMTRQTTAALSVAFSLLATLGIVLAIAGRRRAGPPSGDAPCPMFELLMQ